MRRKVSPGAVLLAFCALVRAQSYQITTIAGGGDSGPATAASLNLPFGVASDASGNLYIADRNNNRVRKVSLATGLITTVAGNGFVLYNGDGVAATSAGLAVWSIALDSSGNLYIADSQNNRIRKVTAATGIITTVAGNGNPASGGDGAAATSASLSGHAGLAVDSAGNLYIADQVNNQVRKVTASTGIITTVAGDGARFFSGDGGAATSANLAAPYGVAVDSAGNLYIADTSNNRVRKVTASSGIITTIAGNGTAAYSGDGAAAISASLNFPTGVALDSFGNLFIADASNNRIRKVAAATGIITTIAGNGISGSGGDGGAATSANLNQPYGVALDSSDNLYVADTSNNRIRAVPAATGIIATVAGDGTVGYGGDGGAALNATLSTPNGVVLDSSGNVYFADTGNNRIRKVAASGGIISTIAGNGTTLYSGDGGPAVSAGFRGPEGVALDSSGNLYIADANDNRIRKVALDTGIITTIAGNGTGAFSGDGGLATSASLRNPRALALDSAGNLYFADSGNQRIRKLVLGTGIVTTVAGNGMANYGGDGDPATSDSLYDPGGVTVDSSGNVYISDSINNLIREVTAADGIINTVAGNVLSPGFSGDGGAAAGAGLLYPLGIAVDSSGNLYFADSNDHRIRRVDAVTGIITTIAGTGTYGFTGDGGPATSAALFQPSGVTLDASGNIYFADSGNNRIRKLTLQAAPVAVTISTAPAGLSVTIDGTVTTTPQTFPWIPGSTHTLFAADQTAVSGLRYTFSAWSQGGSASQTVTVSGAATSTYTAAFTLLPPAISCPPGSAQAQAGLAYTITCTTSGGMAPYTWSISAGALPNGLALNASTGAITGTPATAGLYSFTVQAVDSNNPAQTASANLGFAVVLQPQTITFNALPDVPLSMASVNLTATASSTLTVNYVSNTPTVCAVSGSAVTILISGGCSMIASQPGNATYAAAAPVTQTFTVLFADAGTNGSAYYSAAVNLVAQLGITAGCGSNDYCPTQNVNRYQMAIFMVRAIEGGDNFTFSPTPYFADVPSGATGFKWIQKMFELGITGGCSNVNGVRNYCPNDTITRAQMAIFLMRVRYGTAGPPDFPATPYFTDEPATDATYFKWIQRMKLDGITGGCSTGTYCPGSPVIRGDMAIFIMRGAFNQLLPKGTAVIASISPSTLAVGASGTFTVTGTNTNFVQGTTTIAPIPGVTVGAITVTSPTVLTVQLTAAATATAQPYSVLAMTAGEEAVLPNGLSITAVVTGNSIGTTHQFEYLPADLIGGEGFNDNSVVSDTGREFMDSNSAR
jgi:sugar lactone lactonase YvrE